MPAPRPPRPIADDRGWQRRLAHLRGDVDRHVIALAAVHSWKAGTVRESNQGEYVVVEATRGDATHRIAVLYSSSIRTPTQWPPADVEAVFAEHVATDGSGLKPPPRDVDEFDQLLAEWNSKAVDGRLAVGVDDSNVVQPGEGRILLAENPIDAVWHRLRQFRSVTIARKLVERRAANAGVTFVTDVIHERATAIAYSLGNAADYFSGAATRNLSQRILNLYYGTMAFASAEMLAFPRGTATLDEIERYTKQGHGLYTVDGQDDLAEHICVSVFYNGFFAEWMKYRGHSTAHLPKSKAKAFVDLNKQAANTWITLEGLFARVPEIADIFLDVCASKPAWVTPIYDNDGNGRFAAGQSSQSYILLNDRSARLLREDLLVVPELEELSSGKADAPGRTFRGVVKHPNEKFWHGAIDVYHSPFTSKPALLFPIFGTMREFRSISMALLYGLSIVVRYRPSVWRRVLEGNLDYLKVLTEAFLEVAERVLPEHFLQEVSGEQVHAKQPSGLW